MSPANNQLPWMNQVAHELAALQRPNSVALILGPRQHTIALLQQLGLALGHSPASVTALVLEPRVAVSGEEVLNRLKGHFLLYDLESLCWQPMWRLDLERVLRLHAKYHGVVALWPGSNNGSRLIFSTPLRPDYVDIEARDLSLLTPKPTRFPDEVPFTLERMSR